mgnify:CR=1 FL=1
MLKIGVQTQNAIDDAHPAGSFARLRRVGFGCVDFSLHSYLLNKEIYRQEINSFFDRSIDDLKAFFAPHKEAAMRAGIKIHQMHMPYPIYVPKGSETLNRYLWHEVAPKSMELCAFLECKYIVVHGFKLARFLGSEDAEWEETERFIHSIAPTAKEHGITICIENLYDAIADHLIEGPCCDARKAVERIDRVNDKYNAEVLGFCFDTGHANVIGLDFEAFLTTLGPRLKVLHIHDNDGVRDLHQIPFTFTRTRENISSTDWDGFIRGLRNIHFDGVLNFETGPTLNAFPPSLHEDVLRLIANIGNHFAKQLEAPTMEVGHEL